MEKLNLTSLRSRVKCILNVTMDTDCLETNTVSVNQIRNGVDGYHLVNVSTEEAN